MEKERKYQHAFVKYTKAGKIVSGSLIIARNYPKDNGVWIEVTESICCEPDCECTGNGIKRAYIRFSQGHVVPGSLLISDMCPPDIGCWKEIPVDICCREKNCTTSTTSSTTTTTTIQPVTTSTTSTTSTSTTSTTTTEQPTTSTSTTSSTSSTTTSTSSTSTTSTSTTTTTLQPTTTSTSTTSTSSSTTSTSTSSTTTLSTTSTTSTSSTTTTTTSSTEINTFEILIDTALGLNFSDTVIYSGVNINGTVDWGDGNTDILSPNTSLILSHTYSTSGIYTILLTVENQVGNTITFDVLKEYYLSQPEIISLTSVINPSPIIYYIYGKGNIILNLTNSVNLTSINISGINAILSNNLNVTNILDLSNSDYLQYIVFNFANIPDLLLSNALFSGSFFINIYAATNTTLNNLLIAADNSGLTNNALTSDLSGSASGAGLTAYNNLITKGWTVAINP